MDDSVATFEIVPQRPALPQPTRLRWQPLRMGVIELFHYDSEEFWFRDGHLLLRGNNGTGKSKLLALTLPFLLDANLRPSRIEPDGDPAKRMAWNLLMNSYDRRIGYAWIEFGRQGEDGLPRYLLLGAGLSAMAARGDVESWFFIVEGDQTGPRLGEDLWLATKNRIVLGRERLREIIAGHGQVFETGASYRRAVDEHLFRLGTKRYDALIDTLIQLRQPQLSRKPDEAALSNALTEALPPLAIELLGDVAEALNQLEEDRRQLEEYQQLAQAVERFERRYRVYAGTVTRRQVRELRQAQTDFDNASRARNDAAERLERAQAAEAQAKAEHEHVELALAGHRTRWETLQSNPTMQDANRLEAAERDKTRRGAALEGMRTVHAEVDRRLEREAERTRQAAAAARAAEQALRDRRADSAKAAARAGLGTSFAEHPLALAESVSLSQMSSRELEAAQAGLRAIVAARREQLSMLRRRHAELAKAETARAQQQHALDEKQEEFDAAAKRRAQADAKVEHEGRSLVEAWMAHCATLRQLRGDMAAPLAALGEWVGQLQGDNPIETTLRAAQQEASVRLASLQHELDISASTVRNERAALAAERDGLAAGRMSGPAAPYTRGADVRRDRPGAPLWQLIDFRDHLDEASRAGLEAALEASGLLDGWVSPEGELVAADGEIVRYDSHAVARPRLPASSLAEWLCVSMDAAAPVPAETVDRVLAGIACGEADTGETEAWVSPSGRFRLGALAGAWGKAQPAYVGFAARGAARARRLAEIDQRLDELAQEQTALDARYVALAAARLEAEQEWRAAPSDMPLCQAHLAASAASRAFNDAGERLAQARRLWSDAEQSAHAARTALERDAADLNLPAAADALDAVGDAVEQFNDSLHQLALGVHDWRRAWPDLERQQSREAEARQELKRSDEQLALAGREAEEARVQYEVLRNSVGAKVDTLRMQLAAARAAVEAGEASVKASADALRDAGEDRAVTTKNAEIAAAALVERVDARAKAVMRLQRFAASGLLLSALPTMELPDPSATWTIDPALTLARRAEQALTHIKDDDDSWDRLQRHIAEDLQDLQRALSALGHQAPAEPSDWGLIVHIIYQNRPERPDLLAVRLAEEIAQRSELLTAREREVLENHLQAEIAAEVQRLIQGADKQVVAINRELHKRPTGTGVRYRLQWLPLPEDEGAPVGLTAARDSLLNTSADLWSSDDRRAIGAMLQQRIAAERERAEAGEGGHGGGSLLDQLARALDYRRWHQFRVQRHQDGQWRKLSGPASSGERALGLTVPLFAAISSFYSQSRHPHGPRLMLLDEAFAGIDDSARAHCMGLIREFDLDFVMTSEREWGCYAELPGVAICQLQRREGIDAVYVSRWSWDGRARRREDDPDRRFAPA
jgi:uncharacterized protein (TIGR02680 family)